MGKKDQAQPGDFFDSDRNFNEVYPNKIRLLASQHWTPIHIAKAAADFLAGDGCKILDIGSGSGKFCLAGAHYAPVAHFTGIEQRKYLVASALNAREKLGLLNVSFIHGNVTQLNLKEFDHFYFYNSFFENLHDSGRIDQSIECSESLFEYYVMFLFKELREMPSGTKIATFHTFHGEVPMGYEMVQSTHNGELNFWVKV